MNETFWDGSAKGSDIDLPAFFDSGVSDGLIGVLSLGVLVSLGVTRDGGALGITILSDGRRRREYFRDSEAATDFLRGAVVALSGAGVGATANGGPVGQKPTRGR
jgi:hypothetical protein